MDNKTLFLQNKEIAHWWSGVTTDNRFNMVLLYASGCAMEALPSSEQREGALQMQRILLTLSESEAPPVQFPRSKISHDLDVKRRTLKPKEEKKK